MKHDLIQMSMSPQAFISLLIGIAALGGAYLKLWRSSDGWKDSIRKCQTTHSDKISGAADDASSDLITCRLEVDEAMNTHVGEINSIKVSMASIESDFRNAHQVREQQYREIKDNLSTLSSHVDKSTDTMSTKIDNLTKLFVQHLSK